MLPLAFLGNLGPFEMVVILLVALLLFGGRLPEVGRSLGRGLSQFKKGLQDVKDDLERDEPPASRRPSPPSPDGGRRALPPPAEPRAEPPAGEPPSGD